jgi:hypothetical protein
MSLSSFALILGAIYYVIGFPLVFTDKKFGEWLDRTLKNEDTLRLIAFPFIGIAVTILGRQSAITPDAEGLLVALAWITLLKGLMMVWWTTEFSRMKDASIDFVLSSYATQIIFGSLLVILGAFFTYLGLIVA